MTGQQAANDANVGLKNGDILVNIKRDILYNLLELPETPQITR